VVCSFCCRPSVREVFCLFPPFLPFVGPALFLSLAPFFLFLPPTPGNLWPGRFELFCQARFSFFVEVSSFPFPCHNVRFFPRGLSWSFSPPPQPQKGLMDQAPQKKPPPGVSLFLRLGEPLSLFLPFFPHFPQCPYREKTQSRKILPSRLFPQTRTRTMHGPSTYPPLFFSRFGLFFFQPMPVFPPPPELKSPQSSHFFLFRSTPRWSQLFTVFPFRWGGVVKFVGGGGGGA